MRRPNLATSDTCTSGTTLEHARNRTRNGQSQVHIVRELLIELEGEFKAAQELVNLTTEGEKQDHEAIYVDESLRELDEALSADIEGSFDSLSAAEEVDIHHAINFIKQEDMTIPQVFSKAMDFCG